MKVQDIIEVLTKLPSDLDLKVVDKLRFSSDFIIENGTITVPIKIMSYSKETIKKVNVEEKLFIKDNDIREDFAFLPKEDFLKLYSCYTEFDYDMNTQIMNYANKTKQSLESVLQECNKNF